MGGLIVYAASAPALWSLTVSSPTSMDTPIPPHSVARSNENGASRHPPLLLTDTMPVPDFNPQDAERCFCGSDRNFGECCGTREDGRAPPFGLVVVPEFIDKELAAELVSFANQRPGSRLMVIDQQASTPDNVVKVEDQRRIAERVDLHERRIQVAQLVKSTFVSLAKQYYSATLDWFEAPDLMRYRPGGFYIRHADSQNMDPQTQLWSKVIDRDLSLLIYLNDDFEGGETSFYKFRYQLRPRAGMAVIFPSDHRYLHAAEVVRKGLRYAIVSWASVHGIPKIAAAPPSSALPID